MFESIKCGIKWSLSKHPSIQVLPFMFLTPFTHYTQIVAARKDAEGELILRNPICYFSTEEKMNIE